MANTGVRLVMLNLMTLRKPACVVHYPSDQLLSLPASKRRNGHGRSNICIKVQRSRPPGQFSNITTRFNIHLKPLSSFARLPYYLTITMKFSISASLFVLLGVASALPTEIEARDPSNDPIDVSGSEPPRTHSLTIPIQLINGPDSSKSYQCGDHTYTYDDIYIAAQRGTNLYLVGETRGSKF
jgi:hypothetical protein